MTQTPNAQRATVVLIVDDDDDNRQMYAEFLSSGGYRVAEARDGAEAIAKAEEIEPDLIVMDLALPVVDGWEATRRLKSSASTHRIPIVVLTGHTLGRHMREAEQAGCDGFLQKPCLPERLLLAVQRMACRGQSGVRKVPPRSPQRGATGS